MRAEVFGRGGPAVRSKDNRLVSGHSWARPATPELVSVAHELWVELAGDVALQDAHDLADRFALGDAARDVFAGAFVAAHAGEHDPPQGMVRLTVPARVESMPIDLSGRREQGCDAAEMRERRFALQPVRIVTDCDQQDGGGAGADAVDLEQARRAVSHERLELAVEPPAVGFEGERPPYQRRDREFRRVHHRFAAGSRPERGGGARQTITM